MSFIIEPIQFRDLKNKWVDFHTKGVLLPPLKNMKGETSNYTITIYRYETN